MTTTDKSFSSVFPPITPSQQIMLEYNRTQYKPKGKQVIPSQLILKNISLGTSHGLKDPKSMTQSMFGTNYMFSSKKSIA